jgi:hypothetical protein
MQEHFQWSLPLSHNHHCYYIFIGLNETFWGEREQALVILPQPSEKDV